MFTELTWGTVVGLIFRGLAFTAAGWMVAHGLLPGGTEGEWAAAVGLAGGGFTWSLIQKIKAKRLQNILIAQAIQMPADSTVADVHAAVADAAAVPK